jgi:hypothetical protein
MSGGTGEYDCWKALMDDRKFNSNYCAARQAHHRQQSSVGQ